MFCFCTHVSSGDASHPAGAGYYPTPNPLPASGEGAIVEGAAPPLTPHFWRLFSLCTPFWGFVVCALFLGFAFCIPFLGFAPCIFFFGEMPLPFAAHCLRRAFVDPSLPSPFRGGGLLR